MTDSVAVALITTTGGMMAWAAKTWWDFRERRRQGEDSEKDECERYKAAFRASMHYGRSLKQSIMAIETLRSANEEYALLRLTELANEPSDIFDNLRDYVAGKRDEI